MRHTARAAPDGSPIYQLARTWSCHRTIIIQRLHPVEPGPDRWGAADSIRAAALLTNLTLRRLQIAQRMSPDTLAHPIRTLTRRIQRHLRYGRPLTISHRDITACLFKTAIGPPTGVSP
jgi:hypothetical protein